MNVLVTGASGFVGKHLISQLSKENITVIATTTSKSFDGLPIYPNLKWVTCDLNSKDSIEALFQRYFFKQIYHLAAVASTVNHDHQYYYYINVVGTIRLLDIVEKYSKEAKVLLVSSSFVYGEVKENEIPIKEGVRLNPNNHYAASKTAMEIAANPYICRGLQIIIARPFNHTGPFQTEQYVCSNFAKQFALINNGLKTPKLNVGNINIKRDFTNVKDVVKAYIGLMRNDISGEIVNVCSSKAISIKEIIYKLECISGIKVEINQELKRVRKTDVPVIMGSHDKLHRLTGWQPTVSIDETLKELYNYWNENV